MQNENAENFPFNLRLKSLNDKYFTCGISIFSSIKCTIKQIFSFMKSVSVMFTVLVLSSSILFCVNMFAWFCYIDSIAWTLKEKIKRKLKTTKVGRAWKTIAFNLASIELASTYISIFLLILDIINGS